MDREGKKMDLNDIGLFLPDGLLKKKDYDSGKLANNDLRLL